jgi:hypothetical protein
MNAITPSSINASAADAAQEREIRMRFMRIDARTGELLREFWKVVEPALPKLLEGFFQHITREPKLARMIGSDLPRIKTAQVAHWARLFNGRFDHEYMQGACNIGHILNNIGLEPRWYIGGYNFVLSQLAVLAVGKYRWKSGQLADILTAVNCAVMLDMDIAISGYQEAMLADRQKKQDKLTTAIQEYRRQGGGASQPVERHDSRPRHSGAANRRRRRTDQQHRRPNQPSGSECHHRSGARR